MLPAAQPEHDLKPSPKTAAATAPAAADPKQDADEWVRLTDTVKARSQASVSAPGLWLYQAGSKAQVVGREDGWVQLQDPKTQARGWVYHAYLAPADAAPAQTARKAPPAEAVSPARQAPVRTARPAARTAEPAQARKAKRPRRGLFKRRRAQRAWSVGPAR